MDESKLRNLDPVEETPVTVPLINGTTVAITYFASDQRAQNILPKTQVEGKYATRLGNPNGEN